MQAIILPPLGVFFARGCGCDFLINVSVSPAPLPHPRGRRFLTAISSPCLMYVLLDRRLVRNSVKRRSQHCLLRRSF